MRPMLGYALAGFLVLGLSRPTSNPMDRRVEAILRRLYPDTGAVTRQFVYLTPQQADRVAALAGIRPDTRLFTFYIATRAGAPRAYAAVDTHILRTHHETVLIVLTPEGRVRQVEILSFQEPPDYRPTDRWLDLFRGRSLDPELSIGRAIPNITGATITATALVRRTRLILAVWKVVFGARP